MDSIVEAKLQEFLRATWHYQAPERRAIIDQIDARARAAGFETGPRFAHAGLGAGPEGRAASRLVGRALGLYGDETAEYALKREIDEWLRVSPRTRV
jgi:hypothetical protein